MRCDELNLGPECVRAGGGAGELGEEGDGERSQGRPARRGGGRGLRRGGAFADGSCCLGTKPATCRASPVRGGDEGLVTRIQPPQGRGADSGGARGQLQPLFLCLHPGTRSLGLEAGFFPHRPRRAPGARRTGMATGLAFLRSGDECVRRRLWFRRTSGPSRPLLRAPAALPAVTSTHLRAEPLPGRPARCPGISVAADIVQD